MSDPKTTHQRFMRLALREGRKGLGRTSPNPPVGAVIVKRGKVIGKGWHRKVGEAHAEVNAIADARKKHPRTSLRGATIYVTLEPCSTHGRTPPCIDGILENGIGTVVIGALDPNPDHAGRAVGILEAKGVKVIAGVCEKEAKDLIRFFAKHITTGRPYVIAKTAATLDGRTKLPPKLGQWISSPESREDVQKIRSGLDAILVGGETARADNPHLTLRGKHASGRPQPLRIVLTESGDLPETLNLFTDAFADRTQVFRGSSLSRVLTALGKQGVTSVMLESGGRLLAHALQKKLVDEVVLYQAPILGGGSSHMLPIDNLVTNLEEIVIEKIGGDIKTTGRVKRTSVL